MSQKSLTILGVVLIIIVGVVSVSALLYTHLYGTIGGNIAIQGTGEAGQRINIYGPRNCNTSWPPQLSLQGASIPLPDNITTMNKGEVARIIYSVFNNNTHHTYNITLSINHSWFDDPLNAWYGFTYGFGPHKEENPIVTEIKFNLSTNETHQFYVWFAVDYNMVTPPSGYVHPTISIAAVKV